MKDYELTYDEFWKDVVENKDGTLNLDQVKRELHDYKYLLTELPQLYDELVGLSKPFYTHRDILNRVYEKFLDKQDTLDDLLNMADGNGNVSVEDIKNYIGESI